MPTLAINPLMLAAGVLFSWLLFRMMRRGTIILNAGVVSRDKSPIAFWLVFAVNALIVVAAFAMGLGLLKR